MSKLEVAEMDQRGCELISSLGRAWAAEGSGVCFVSVSKPWWLEGRGVERVRELELAAVSGTVPDDAQR